MESDRYNFRRVDPRSLIIFLGGSALSYAILYFSFEAFRSSWLVLAALAFLAASQLLSRFIFFKYAVSSSEIVIHSGVFNRVRRNIPSERIQNVALERNVLARILNLAAVKIETAGSVKAEGVLEYVGIAEAHRVRTLLRSAKAESTAEATVTIESDYSMSLPQVMLSGMYTFSLIYFAVGWAIFGQLDQLNLIDMEAVLASLTSEQLEAFMERSRQFPILLVIPIMIGGLLLGWLTGIVVHVVRYYNFSLELRPKKIHRRFGLFTLRETTIPYPRVQTLVLRSNPLMRLHDRFRLVLQTLAFDTSERGMQMAIPLARLPRLLHLAKRIHDFSMPETFNPVARATIRRFGFRYTLALAVLVAGAHLLWSPALWGLAVLPLLWILAWLQYVHHDWTFDDDHLFVRRGVFWQKVWIVPVNRFQAIQTSATLLQRRLGICQVTVDTAGAGAFQYPRIVDISKESADQLIPELYEAFRRSMAANRHADSIHAMRRDPDQTDPSGPSHTAEQVHSHQYRPQYTGHHTEPSNRGDGAGRNDTH